MDVTTHTNAAYTVNHDFIYDDLNRLKTATAICLNDTSRSYNQGYTYDLAGNMTNKTGIGGWDVLTWESGVNKPRIRPKSVRFDAEVAGIAQRNVINNQDQKPVQITYQGGTTNLYYDGAGERIKKVKGTETVIYVGGIYEVRNGQAMSYVYANGQKIATLTNNKEYYTHSDHLGSTAIVTDETGTVVEEIGYLPFGSTLFRNTFNGSTWASAYRFTGQEFDEEYHLYNYNARLYDPIMSRFITPDTIVPNPYNPQSLNRYTYCLNNPLIYVDPSGHQEEEFTYGDFCLYRDMLAHELKMREMYGGGYNTPYSLGFTTGFESWLFLSGTDFWNMGFAEYNNFLRWNALGGGVAHASEGSVDLGDASYKKIPKKELRFDGKRLGYIENGKCVKAWMATSGMIGSTPEDQYLEDLGPIPEGKYKVNPNEINYDRWWKIGWGDPDDWGAVRTPIRPLDGTNLGGRKGGFYLHGGAWPGSIGCIDLTDWNDHFHSWFAKQKGPITLIVDYSK